MTTTNITSTLTVNTRHVVNLVSYINQISTGSVMIRKFSNDVDRQVNARTVIGVLSLTIKKGDLLTISCYDNDEDEEKLTVAKITKWFEDNKEDS